MIDFWGIDYGAQNAGTTRICKLKSGTLQILRSVKKKAADCFIQNELAMHKPGLIGIDAPLSIPGAYLGSGSNFHYRVADQELSAMSPMFLGGLTARAMSLKSSLSSEMIEVYPAARVRHNEVLKTLYKKKDKNSLPDLIHFLSHELKLTVSDIHDYHDIDSIIAWWITRDYLTKKAQKAGHMDEGIIYY